MVALSRGAIYGALHVCAQNARRDESRLYKKNEHFWGTLRCTEKE